MNVWVLVITILSFNPNVPSQQGVVVVGSSPQTNTKEMCEKIAKTESSKLEIAANKAGLKSQVISSCMELDASAMYKNFQGL